MVYSGLGGGAFPIHYCLKKPIVFKVDPKYTLEIPEGTMIIVIISDADLYMDLEDITDTSTQGMLLTKLQYHELPVVGIKKLYFYTDTPPATVRVLPVG